MFLFIFQTLNSQFVSGLSPLLALVYIFGLFYFAILNSFTLLVKLQMPKIIALE